MTSQTILYIIIFIIIFEFIFSTILELINQNYGKGYLPDDLKGLYDEEKYQKSLSYHREQTYFGILTSAFSLVILLSMLFFNGFGYLNNYLAQFISHPLLLSLLFFGVLFFVSDLLNLPFQLYSVFSIEQRYGFNKMDLKTFFIDKIKGYVLAILMGGALLSILIYLIQWLGKDFWWLFWVVISVVIVLLNMFYTSLIVPMFNKLTPLEEGDLKNAIMNYCKKVNFPLDNLFVIDGSKRSTKANAYFSGIGKKKKIVLYDTLIKEHSEDELVAVLAHEVGHFKKKHIIYTLVISVLQIGFTLFILSLMVFNENLSLALGGETTLIHLNLIAFAILYSPISSLTGLLMMILSRKNEYEADDYAKNTFNAGALVTALKKLSVNNLSNLFPHPLYVFFNYSHPPLLERIKNLEKN